MKTFLSINNGVVTNRTIGADVTAQLSIQDSGSTPMGSTTSDGGHTFTLPAPESYDPAPSDKISELTVAIAALQAGIAALSPAADSAIQNAQLSTVK